MKTIRLRTALLGSGAAVALLAGGPAMADEIDDLRAQITALQDKVSQIETDATATPRVAPAAAVEAGSKPKSWKLPGTNTSLNIGGYAKLDLIYDLNANVGPSIGIVTPAASGTAGGNRQGNFQLHSRQSRVWFKSWTPTDWGELATHIEGDFFGAGGNENVSNSHALRLRHAYGRLGPVLAGQTWTNWMDLGALHETLDFAGPTGERFLRQSQIRYTHNFGGGTTLALAIENPQTTAVQTAADAGASGVATGIATVDHTPDGVAMLRHRFSGGHVALAAVLRSHDIDAGGPNGFSDSVFGFGIAVSGSYAIMPTTKLRGSFTYGDGVGRYFLTGALLNSVVITGITPGTAKLNSIRAYGGHVSIAHKWTDTLRSNVAVAFSNTDVEDEVGASLTATAKGNIAAGTRDLTNTVHANLIWSPVPQVNFGVEYIWGQSRSHNATNSRLSRVQVGMQYKF